MMFEYVPSEFNIGGVYFPPLLIAALLGAVLSWVSVMLLNRYRLSRFMVYPPLIFVAIATIYTCLIGTFLIPV
jgi:hypothetical protein